MTINLQLSFSAFLAIIYIFIILKSIGVLIISNFNLGNVQLGNIMDDEACIMRFTPFVQASMGAYLVKYDPIEEELILDKNGFAIKADYDEPGKNFDKNMNLNKNSRSVNWENKARFSI